ncbi:hypothetical protein BBBOND_0313790 [Babesia bigemina]|uniref:Uncharacterized protein n=1 Tax=Babesia bigemina TaxID=5866 RepID=A0A061D3Y5_BABBI|nr:hypothetical protein BBBOND_0100180 [Babesia bigemina]XP_012769663.1 hypothetical protein BBBOND_0313790 [Babesia bigemina]CDR93689.1 hypothetical protein BBBOND_0100180 [Babesia bigemina]CDR97477.1 hypothetical protein BBBOND_0313790 [Babesia bigemina]|eukprot:XP_012765875.1 hypothetical protein BBBOND_0100180 [Babesia bigemina]
MTNTGRAIIRIAPDTAMPAAYPGSSSSPILFKNYSTTPPLHSNEIRTSNLEHLRPTDKM